ncbi:MAG: phospho-sugar mutase, partial [Actinomycetota bacterium]|nr:phospho-sugar mutase [Actinomycetota bacterium]
AHPDPEEAGALDLALSEATAIGASGVLAHDPDGDRLALAVPAGGGWRVLTGDELGVLLADHVLSHTAGADRLVVSTVVSSTLLGRIAADHGVRHAVTLPGFKWVMRAAERHPGTRFTFGYEEALGYAVSDLVGDKDGLTAAAATARMLADLAARGRTVLDQLEAIARRHGLHATTSWSIRTGRGPRGIEEAVDALTDDPPASLDGRTVTAISLPGPRIVLLEVDGGVRVAVRPSGTEAKLKCYVQVIVPHVGPGTPGWAGAQAEGAATLGRVRGAITARLGLEPATIP